MRGCDKQERSGRASRDVVVMPQKARPKYSSHPPTRVTTTRGTMLTTQQRGGGLKAPAHVSSSAFSNTRQKLSKHCGKSCAAEPNIYEGHNALLDRLMRQRCCYHLRRRETSAKKQCAVVLVLPLCASQLWDVGASRALWSAAVRKVHLEQH